MPLLVAVTVLAPTVGANGGTVQLSNVALGPYLVTAYTDPTPILTGVVDVSVLVQQAGSRDLVQDASVAVMAAPLAGSEPDKLFPATHDQATNKLFYAANVRVPTAGSWRLRLHVQGKAGSGDAQFDVDVNQAGLFNAALAVPLLVLFPVLALVVWARRGALRGQFWRKEPTHGG